MRGKVQGENVTEIGIHVGNLWGGEDGEELLAKRIARIVASDDISVYRQKHGYKWVLDAWSNDWFMTGIENGAVKVAYRYGDGRNKPIMDALQLFLQWSIGSKKPERDVRDE